MSFNTKNTSLHIHLVLTSAVFLALAAGACFSACSRADRKPTGPPEKITIAYAPPPYTALADIAQSQGFFLQEGLDATPQYHSTGKDALKEVLAGRADVATVAETPFMFAVMKGHALSIIATIQRSNTNVVVFARRDKGIRNPRDLKGKRIAAPLGSGGEYFLDNFLAARNLSKREVKVKDLNPDKMPAALARGDIDAIVAWPPFIAQAQGLLGDKGITFHDEDLLTSTFNIVATRRYIAENPRIIKRFLRALIKAEDYFLRNPPAARKVVTDFRRVDAASLNNMWEGNVFAVSLDQSLLFALEDETRWAIKNGLVDKIEMPDYLEYIYLDGLASVNPKAVRIVR